MLDNEFGVLDLHTDMTISGTLLAPVVEGSLEVSDGRLELDEILPQVADTTYATQAEYQGIPTERLRGAIVPDLLGADDRAPELAPGDEHVHDRGPSGGEQRAADPGHAGRAATVAARCPRDWRASGACHRVGSGHPGTDAAGQAADHLCEPLRRHRPEHPGADSGQPGGARSGHRGGAGVGR